MADQISRIEALLDEQEAAVRRAFLSFIAGVNSKAVLDQIEDLLERGDVNAALAIVDSYIIRFADVLPSIQQTVGIAAAAELAELAGEAIIAISFDPSHPRAAQLARASRLTLIREFTAEQRQAVRQAIGRAFDEGTGTGSTARAFREAIGLNSEQEAWVASFRGQLRRLDAKALSRALRDRRFDRTVARAIQRKEALSEARIDRMVERYRARTLAMRSENIARTEALRATSQAREEALRQMIEQTGMDPRRVERIWNATRDRRTRDAHTAMDKQRRGVDQAFEDGDGNALMWPGDPAAPPETTINCFPLGVAILPAGLREVIARHYSGELIKLLLADGVDLSVTPNHPVLTQRGWILAKELLESDYVVKDARIRDFPIGYPNINYGYSFAERLEYLAQISGRKRTHRGIVDFHGETPKHDVEIISPPSFLLDRWNAIGREFFGNLGFEHSDTLSGQLLFDRLCALDHGAIPFAPRNLGFLSKLFALLGRHSLKANSVRLGSGTDRQAKISQAATNNLARHFKLDCHLADRNSASVQFPNLVKQGGPRFAPVRISRICRTHYEGPLFNFETDSGIIMANGIVTHNCRCTLTFSIKPPAQT